MASPELRQRLPQSTAKLEPDAPALSSPTQGFHPAGSVKYGLVNQVLRGLMFNTYFMGCCFVILINQLIGAPLYFINKDYYYAWMAMTKQQFGLVLVYMTWWWAPSKMHVSWDRSLEGQFRKTEDGRLETLFPERLILIANHQIYTDWVYLWWMTYTSRMHGHIFIILKETLKYIPIIGQGMMFYGFIFLSRKWATDKPRFQHRLRKLNSRHHGPLSGSGSLDPMWLLIFPEGTNMSRNSKESSKRWAEKTGVEPLDHLLLPRHTGLHFCLEELKNTVDWIYDCTLVYEGIPQGEFGQDIFTLRSSYLEGRPPKAIHLHWRRFAVSSIPADNSDEFAAWLAERWREKDKILQYYVDHGHFPSDGSEFSGLQNGSVLEKSTKGDYTIETGVKPQSPFEFLQVFLPVGAFLLVVNILVKLIKIIRTTLGS